MHRLFAMVLAISLTNAPVAAQDGGLIPPPVLVVDAERLYADSKYGLSMRQAIDQAATDLNTENVQIVADLTAEEQSLAARRPSMDPTAFREEAAAFDAKVQDIRNARDAKEQELQQSRSAARTQFFDEVRPIIGQLLVDRGGVAVLDSRSIFVVVRSLDITDEAIALIDDALAPKAP